MGDLVKLVEARLPFANDDLESSWSRAWETELVPCGDAHERLHKQRMKK